MRLLLLSDIHAYADALERVLRDAEGDWDEAVILGDIVGYGPEPVRAVERVRDLPRRATILGNHEAMLFRLLDGERVPAAGRVVTALESHAKQLDDDHISFLRALDDRYEDDAWAAVHGSPRERFEYLLSVPDARAIEPHMPRDIVCIGHTHVPGAYLNDTGRWRVMPVKHGSRVLEIPDGAKVFVNPGSVGPARDGGPGAAYAILDEEERRVVWRRGI